MKVTLTLMLKYMQQTNELENNYNAKCNRPTQEQMQIL